MLTYFDFPDNVVAFSTTRHGGCSVGNYGSFNINPYCGDSAEAVAANKKELCGLLGVDEERLVLPHQTHQTQVRQIAEDFFSLSDATRTMLLEGVDALMTNVKGICIGVSTADCIPIIIYEGCVGRKSKNMQKSFENVWRYQNFAYLCTRNPKEAPQGR